MNRRSFVTALVGVPIVGLGARMFGLSKPTAKGGITVHGPEWIDIHDAYSKLRPAVSLRFENVPLQPGELLTRLQSIGGIVNRSEWNWYANNRPDRVAMLPTEKGMLTPLPRGYDVFQPKYLPLLNTHLARTLMFTDFGFSQPENGLTSVMCAFTPASDRPPWPGSHRPVDFEAEILKALEGKR